MIYCHIDGAQVRLSPADHSDDPGPIFRLPVPRPIKALDVDFVREIQRRRRQINNVKNDAVHSPRTQISGLPLTNGIITDSSDPISLVLTWYGIHVYLPAQKSWLELIKFLFFA